MWQCGENCTGMQAMPVGKLSTNRANPTIYGKMNINVNNWKTCQLLQQKNSLTFINSKNLFLDFLFFP